MSHIILRLFRFYLMPLDHPYSQNFKSTQNLHTIQKT